MSALIFLLFIVYVNSALIAPDTLKQVHIIFRHGDRAPVDPYAKSPNLNYVWPNGLSQLTNLGKKQQYELGAFLRNRYQNFFTRDPREIEVKSSDKDRCIASAQVNLAAFFKPEGKFIWKDDLIWQPVPIHTKPQSDDFLINEDAICPAADAEVKRFPQTALGQEYTEKYRDLMEYMTQNSGDRVYDPTSLQSVQGVIGIEKIHNLIIPPWVESRYAEMVEAASEGFTVKYASKKIQRLRGGPLVKYALGLMKDEASNATRNIKKGHMYSTHDAIIAAFLNAMGVFNGRIIPYCATVLMELHQEPGSEGNLDLATIRLYYKNTTELEPFLLQVPNCELNCPLKRFEELMRDIIPNDIREECFGSRVDTVKNVATNLMLPWNKVSSFGPLIFSFLFSIFWTL